MNKKTGALFITNGQEYNCNICSEKIDDDKVIGLKCDPTKHIFCYDCILDWYMELSHSTNNNYPIKNMCPICRKNGGLLPLLDESTFIKNIHYDSSKNKIVLNPNKKNGECGVLIPSSNLFCKCPGYEELSGFCKKHKKYHEIMLYEKKINKNNIENNDNKQELNKDENDKPNNEEIKNEETKNEETKIDEYKNSLDFILEEAVNEELNDGLKNILNDIDDGHLCGVKLKSKNGFCTKKGKQIYGGFCGIHGNKNESIII
jgi:hypothetical protein